MSQEVTINPKSVIDFDDRIGSVNVLASGSGTKISWQDTATTNFRTRTGQRAFLVFVGNSVDSGGEAKITFHVLVNGTLLRPPYDAFTQSMGETYNGWARTFARIELPQNAMIEVSADNSDSAVAYNVFARMRIEYESIN